MTLILTRENNFTGVDRFKNPYWVDSKYTPNEKYFYDHQYHRFVDKFCKLNRIPGRPRFFEVRLIRRKTVIELRKYWWDESYWMDKVFWVFQKPDYTIEESKHYGWYALEPMECLRVINKTRQLTGLEKPFKDLRVALIVPEECVQLCWEETLGGYSEHIHHREVVAKSQAQLDAEKEREVKVEKILETAEDIRNSSQWDKTLNLIEDKLVKK